jgi:hypothetical protein
LGRLKNYIKQNNIDLNIVHIYIINKYKITSVLKSEIYNITSIPESPRCESIGLAAILVIMYVETFKANVIMCVMWWLTISPNIGNSGYVLGQEQKCGRVYIYIGLGQEQKCGRVYIYIVDILVNIIPQYKQPTVYK